MGVASVARQAFLASAILLPGAAAQTVNCPVTMDTWIAVAPIEKPASRTSMEAESHGGDSGLPIRGRESFALFQFDVSVLKGRAVDKAVLRVHSDRGGPVPLLVVGLSSISGSAPWTNEANYFYARGKGHDWSYSGSDVTDVTFSQGGSLYSYETARDAGGGWYEINVPPQLVTALVSGDQFGLALTDEKGQTQATHTIDSRESGYPPVLVVSAATAQGAAPGPVRLHDIDSTIEQARKLGRTTLRSGSVILDFGGAGRAGELAAHYDVRYSERPIDEAGFDRAIPVARWMLNPLAPKANPLAVSNALQDRVIAVVEGLKPGAAYYFAARAVDGAGRSGLVSSLGEHRAFARSMPALPPAPEQSQAPARPAAISGALKVWAVPELLKINPRTGELLEKDYPDHRNRNAVWDAATATVKLRGARNEFLGFQLAVESAAPFSGVEVSVSKPLFGSNKLPAVFEKTGAVQLSREWFVPGDKAGAGREWYPDALAPLAPLSIPSRDNPVPQQTVAPVFVDTYVPHDAKPGTYSGELLVRGAGIEKKIRLQVEVLDVTLPDKLGFVVDLNCYSKVPLPPGVNTGTPEYRSLLHGYHRIAHMHRSNLDVLGYSQRGTTEPDQAPPLEGEGAATRVTSWQDWDAHFGPVLSGSAFRDLPRAAVPVPLIYLPFFENWPGDFRKSYRFEHPQEVRSVQEYNELITRHAIEAGPVEQMFSREYQERYSTVVAEFARHIRERGWLGTDYQLFLNNKYYFKKPGFAAFANGSSLWLLDEPNHRDDFRALSFFYTLGLRGLEKYPDVPIRIRSDISRVEWMRDLLAGQLDLNCVSSCLFDKNRYLMDDRVRHGQKFWNYSSTNHPSRTNVSMRAWCWKAWVNGADAIVPWNAAAGRDVWNRAEELTVFYPGDKFGRVEPFPSLRLKAFRRGEQDIEYLILLANHKGWDREAVADAVAKALDLSGGISQSYDEDAGAVTFGRAKDIQMDELRLRIARALTD